MFVSKWRHNSKIYRAEYTAWRDARRRCVSPAIPAYVRYGARGIRMCERWLNDFDAFMTDIGPKPGPEYSIERLDNNQGYDPFNCIWATVRVQARNKRSTIMLTFRGETKTAADWADELGIERTTVYGRIDRKLPVAEILSLGTLVKQPEHGTISMYVSRKCRCNPCREANSKYMLENRHRFPSMTNEYRNRKYAERKNG